MSNPTGRYCPRCGEDLVDQDRPCGFCVQERREEAARKLVAAAPSNDTAALLARAEANSTLRALGYPEETITKARAGALDGFSVEQVLEVLAAPAALEGMRASEALLS